MSIFGSDDKAVREGGVALTRQLSRIAKAQGAISILYYYSHKFSSARSTLPYFQLDTGKVTQRSEVPDEHVEALERCNEFVIKRGSPIVLSQFIEGFRKVEPRLTSELVLFANERGVFEQYMVPVFGPYDVNGVIAFGFGQEIPKNSEPKLEILEDAAISHHNRMVRTYQSQTPDIELSERENDVLTWIVKGKTTKEISTILDISVSSVDTYTRRIFEKMGVNSRVSAAISGVTQGLVKP